jgi:CubicO group peptidase (beta-lactamase class C family)
MPGASFQRWVAALCLGAVALGHGSASGQGPLVARIDEAIHRLGIKDDGPGLGLLVVEKGRVLVKKGYGLANLKTRAPVTPGTTFELGSTSKPFTALAVMILHDQGKLAFTDPVRTYISELPEQAAQRPIRIIDLLHHTSGLPDYTGMDDPESPARGYTTNADYVRLIAAKPRAFRPTFAPGARHEYCNTNYMLLALIVERVAGKSFGTFLREEVFTPLGMERSWVYEAPDSPRARPVPSPHAVGYTRRKNGTYQASWGAPPDRSETLLTTGDGAVWCSLNDMVQWDRGLRSGRLVKRETWRHAMTPSKTADGKSNPYGFGWSLEINDGALTGFFHDGAWGGFQNSYYHSLADDRTIVVLSNHSDLDIDRVWKAITDILDKN